MAFFNPARCLAATGLVLASTIAAAPAQAGLLSPSGKTYLIQGGPNIFYYSSEVNGDRFTGTIRGNYNGAGYFNGSFTDYSTYGEGCSGYFNKGKLQADGTLEISFDVDRSARNHRCNSIGQSFDITVIPFSGEDKAMVWTSGPNQQVAIYRGAQSPRPMESYGVRGDRVRLLTPIHDDLDRVKVRFSSGVTGWIDSNTVIPDRY